MKPPRRATARTVTNRLPRTFAMLASVVKSWTLSALMGDVTQVKGEREIGGGRPRPSERNRPPPPDGARREIRGLKPASSNGPKVFSVEVSGRGQAARP